MQIPEVAGLWDRLPLHYHCSPPHALQVSCRSLRCAISPEVLLGYIVHRLYCSVNSPLTGWVQTCKISTLDQSRSAVNRTAVDRCVPVFFRSAVCWTGGKDCHLAVLKAIAAGFKVEFAITFSPPGALVFLVKIMDSGQLLQVRIEH